MFTSITQRDGQGAEYVTIIAPTFEQVMRRFRDGNLAAQGFSIAGRVMPHHIVFDDGSGKDQVFNGAPMITATFVRSSETRA
ncbi:hypothetical protein [Lutibaculum baratangense]|uniref:Uncharacterized protein n=1 Tax=Lutibaculum baratangense AMV1 TaxID=631454 RepID=V4R4X1_9HYPH|nr:hypothetical protein [Lutibaculum baratangense]ESR26992.1 hypothetical protein N177_0418 [Lutibaculum baratangense AMV1]